MADSFHDFVASQASAREDARGPCVTINQHQEIILANRALIGAALALGMLCGCCAAATRTMWDNRAV
jgi:hypothetical protein